MANKEENQNAAGEASRVYKASEVHKRRTKSPRGVKEASPAVDSASDELSAREQPSPSKSPSSTKKEAPSREKHETRSGATRDDTLSKEDAGVSGQVETSVQAGDTTPSAEEGKKGASALSGGPLEGFEATEASEVDEDAQDANPPAEVPEDKPKKKRGKLIAGIVVGVIVAALLVFAGFTVGSRWLRFDDGADIQGEWYVYGTSVPLTFKDGSIIINDTTSYAYEIDPTAKTITYNLGNLAGQGRYWFDDDRATLVITDGSDYTMWSTLVDDFTYGVKRLFGESSLPTTDTSIVLTRTVVEAPTASPEKTGSEASASSEGGEGSSDANSSEELMVSDIMMTEEESAAADGEWY